MKRMTSISLAIVLLLTILAGSPLHTILRDVRRSFSRIDGYTFDEEDERVVPGDNGGSTRTIGSHTIVITEMTGDQDFCEMVNVGHKPVTITGWKLHGYDEGSNFPSPDFTFTFPSTTVPRGGVFTVTEYGNAPGSYPNFFQGHNIMWVSGGGSRDHGAILVDDKNNIVDMVVSGDINPQQLRPVQPGAQDWIGQPVPAAGHNNAEYRTGDEDTNTAKDWKNNKAPTKGTLQGHGMKIPFIYIPEVSAVGLTRGSNEKICYAGDATYTVSVNITTSDELSDASELKVFLDYNQTNATLTFNWTNKRFGKSQDPVGHVYLKPKSSTYANDGDYRWWVNFTVSFNFSFPHEGPVDCFSKMYSRSGEHTTNRFSDLFRVENDLEFDGTPEFEGEYLGELEEGDWVRGGEALTMRNLTVHYEDAPNIIPREEYFDVRVMDSNGRKWWDNESAGAEVVVNLTARNESVPNEKYLITIENIPDVGFCTTNFTFSIKIDAHAPLAPATVRCVEFDKEVEYVNTPSVNITWDAIIDNGSGLLGYYYSQYDNHGTENGTFTEETEGEITELDEGTREVFVWAVDNVGNIGNAVNSSVLVDLTVPMFADPFPTDGGWHNHTKIECSIGVRDPKGSAVDPESVSYSISTEGPYTFGPWVPVWIPETGESVRPVVKCNFGEGTENYIKWRAKDLSGNGFAESSPVNLKIDITPLAFSEEISPEPGWYKDRRVTSTIYFYDHGSGVDLSSLEARVSTSGENEFGPWMGIREENVTDKDEGYEISFAYSYAEGEDNYIMFRGTDKVANPFSYSRSFNYRIDTTPVYFANFVPLSDEFSDDREVECLIDIYDDGIGVEPKSVEYSISTEGIKDFGAWRRAYDLSVGNPTMVRIEEEFDWGMDNYVRFRANDKIGTGVNTSEPCKVWVNSEPEAVISFPPDNREYKVSEYILFDASNSTDLDGDILSFFWTSNVIENATLGNESKLLVRLAEGNHTIILHVDDGHEYNVSEKVRVNVAGVKEKDGGGGGKGSEGTEQRGTAEESGVDLWVWIVVILSVLFVLIILAVVMLIRKRKKSGKESNIPTPLGQFGVPRPYTQGQYATGPLQSYHTTRAGIQQGKYGTFGGATPMSQSGLSGGGGRGAGLFPTGTGPTTTRQGLPQQQLGGTGAGLVRPALPGPQQPSVLPGQVPSDTLPQYSLPSFGTDKGTQDLNKLALPPAPPEEMGTVSVGIGGEESGSVEGGSMESQTAKSGDAEEPIISPAPPSEYGAEVPGGAEAAPSPPPAVPPTPPDSPPDDEEEGVSDKEGPRPDLPPPGPNDDGSDQEFSLERVFAGLEGLDADEGPPPPEEENGLKAKDGNGGEENLKVLQCHSCEKKYKAVVDKFPVVVTCPHCGSKGKIGQA